MAITEQEAPGHFDTFVCAIEKVVAAEYKVQCLQCYLKLLHTKRPSSAFFVSVIYVDVQARAAAAVSQGLRACKQ